MLPNHVAIIMDGNGRWAQSRGRARSYGHVMGAKVVKSIVEHCGKKNIKFLTLYTFSTENWKRPESEVNLLMKLLNRYLSKETQNLINENVSLRVIGDVDQFPESVQRRIQKSVEETSHCSGLVLTLALNYGGRTEIVSAIKKLAEEVKRGDLDPENISEAEVSGAFTSAWLPDPDLIIRTSGEQRLSNFLTWQSIYSEIYFTEIHWPDFSTGELDVALNWFSNRDRRFGDIVNISKQNDSSTTEANAERNWVQ